MSADLSSAQLAERLEKSEAGRKKLRQAISILQEKLAASEKLLKDNDTLQQECERERQRAESEKKKAEEERRLRATLEKDSATIKDQLAKVFQRLGTVENKQKVNKKEVERLQNEVKLSVEGMRVAAQAVDAVQSSFQSLEIILLEKVNAAFTEAHAASEAVHHLQSSFQSLENMVVKKGSSPDKQLVLSVTKPVSEKLVDEISRLFHKEKQSHCKIEQRLSKLKSVLKQGRWVNSLTTAENFDLENPAFSKIEEEKASKKRKPQGEEEELLNRKARKRKKLYDVDVVNSAVNRSNVDVPKEANDGQSMSSPFSIDYQMTSEEPGFVPHVPHTASNECIEEAIVNHTCSSNVKVRLQVPPVGGKAQKEIRKSSFAQWERIDGGLDVNDGCLKNMCMQNEGIPETEGVLKMMQHRSIGQLAGQEEIHGRGSTADVPASLRIDDSNEASDSDLNSDLSDDSDNEWWSQDRILLSPSLPEIPSPLHHSSFSSREPSPSRAEACTASVAFGLEKCSSKVPVSDSYVPTEAATNMANAQYAGMQHGCKSINVCNKQLDVSSQTSLVVSSPSLQTGSCSRAEEQPNKVELSTECQLVHFDNHTEVGVNGVEHKVQSVNLDEAAGFSVPEGAVESSAKETESSLHESCPNLDPISATNFGPENLVSSDKEENLQFDDVFGFEAVDSATLTEIDNFLEVLPPIRTTFESCASDVPQVPTEVGMPNCAGAKTCDIAANEVYTSIQPQAACEMLMSKVIDTKDCSTIDCSFEKSCGFQQVTNVSIAQGPPIQEESHSFKVTTYVSESSNCLDPQAVLMSSTKPSSSSVVFLLQAFDVHGVDAELNVIAACIMAINFKGYLQAISADKEEKQLQGATLSRASANIPMEYLACSFISVAVDVVRLENGGDHCSSEAKPIFVLVQVLVAFIRSMFKENASIILDTIFAQLVRFLIQGEAMLVTLHGSMTSCQDALSYARVFQDPKYHSHQYTEATLEDIHAGGKVLAALCQVLSCVTHLQNIVYEVLGWCDKDIMWLLTVFSSFSSICGNTAFMVEADDLLGHAICAIILELVASVEQECMIRVEATINKATRNSASLSSNFPMGWAAMKESLEVNGKMSVEEVVVAVFEALRDICSSTHESLVLASQPLVENVPLCTKECSNHNTRPQEGSDFSEEEALKDSGPLQEVTKQNILSERLVNGARGSEKWQKKYGEAVGALQLIVQFMGWEWAYNHLIIRCLWREAVSGSAQLCVAAVSHILSILWRMGVQGGGSELHGLAELKKCLVHVVQSTSLFAGKAEPFILFDQ